MEQDLAGLAGLPRKLMYFLDMTSDVVRSCPSRHSEKKFVSTPHTHSVSQCGYSAGLNIFVGQDALAKAKEGQREKVKKKGNPNRWTPGVLIPSQRSHTLHIHQQNMTRWLLYQMATCVVL